MSRCLFRSQLRWQTAHQHNKMMDSIWRAQAQLQCFWHMMLWNLILTDTHVHTNCWLSVRRHNSEHSFENGQTISFALSALQHNNDRPVFQQAGRFCPIHFLLMGFNSIKHPNLRIHQDFRRFRTPFTNVVHILCSLFIKHFG